MRESELIRRWDKPESIRTVSRNGIDKPVVALDIDGTLGDYHKHFLQFAMNYFGCSMPHPRQINPGRRLWEHMGVTLMEYRDAKLAYRQGGFKRWMPVYDGAAELAADVQKAGAEVWICTTRPYMRLDNIDPDTREWLRRNGIKYDAVLFNDRDRDGGKYVELVKQVGRSRIVAVADDLPEGLQEAWRAEINRIYIRDQPYNRHFNPRWADRVDNLYDLRDYIVSHINDYKEHQ